MQPSADALAMVPSWPPVMSPEFLKRAIRTPASPDADEATAQTIDVMCREIRESAADPLVQRCAHAAVQQFRGGPLWAISGIEPFSDARSREQAIAESCFWWAKHNLRFVHHDELIEVLLGEVGQLQLLISPDVLVRMNRMEGDCAIYTMVVCAMLETFGLQWEIVTLAVNPQEPEIFGHVFARAILSDGRRLALDASHGTYPGWQVPASDVSRSQVWDESASPIADQGARFNGLHNYVRRGFGQTVDETGTITDPAWYAQFAPEEPEYTAPAQSSTDWAAFATQLLKSGMTLAQINAIQPGTVVGPQGQILRQAAGYPVPVGQSLSITGGTGGTMILLGGALLAIVFVMVMAKKS